MYKAVIFDFGDVILEYDNVEVWPQVCAKYQCEPQVLKKLVWDFFYGSHVAKYDTIADFYKASEPQGGIPLSVAEEAVESIKSTWRINQDVIKTIQELQGQYKLALLSNFQRGLEQIIQEQFKIDHYFDVVVSSYNFKIKKPDPAIYRYTLEQLGLPAAECIFIDDLQKNVTAANELGMTGIVFTDAASCRGQLFKLLGKE